MNFLFWLLWILNLAFAVLIMWSNSYRSGYGAGIDLNTLLLIGVAMILAGSLLLRYGCNRNRLSLWIVAMPVFAMVIWYLVEEIQDALK